MGRIQARWRGLSVRRYLVVFRKEKGRQREVRASMIFRIQRIVRGWSHRKHAIGWYSKRVGQKALAEYLAKKLSENYDNACTDGMTRLRKAYITERYAVEEFHGRNGPPQHRKKYGSRVLKYVVDYCECTVLLKNTKKQREQGLLLFS